MTLAEVKKILDAEVIVGEDMLNMQVERGFAADLMSDVLAFAKEGSMLLTGLTNPLVVRTADTLDLKVIIFVRGKRPAPDAIKLAQEKNIPLLAHPLHPVRIVWEALRGGHARIGTEGGRAAGIAALPLYSSAVSSLEHEYIEVFS